MAYIKTEWKARQGTGLNRFRKSREDEEFIYLDNEPEQITEQGTSFSTERMNNIEDGIYDAHEAVSAEIQARIQGDENTLADALEAIDTHDESGEAHENLFAQTIKRSAMGAAGGVATLDSHGKVPVNQLPAEVAGDLTGILEAVDKINETLSKQFYTGKLYEQKPNDPDPYELIETGVFPEGSVWELWSCRAELYELVPAASFPSGVTEYTTGSSVPINAYRIYQMTGDDRQIWKSNKALTNLPAQINPLGWNKLPDITCVPRRRLQPDWDDDDLEIGAEVMHNGQQMIVAGIIVLGGKFLSVEGGNRPSFVSGGVAGDVQRLLNGTFGPGGGRKFSSINNTTGIFYGINTSSEAIGTGIADKTGYQILGFDTSLVVPTGVGNNHLPRTLSVRYWRRVA